MLDHANSDQISAISEMVLNLLKQNNPIHAPTFNKLKRYKTVERAPIAQKFCETKA